MEQEHPAIVDLLRRARVGNGQQRLTEAVMRAQALLARCDGVEPASRVSCSTPVPAPAET